jgi:hypothetical protein
MKSTLHRPLTNAEVKKVQELATKVQRLINEYENNLGLIIDVEVRRLRERGSLAPIVKVTAHAFRGWEEELENECNIKKSRKLVCNTGKRN